MDRAEKEALKRPDEFVSFFRQFVSWIALHIRGVYFVLGALAVVGVGFVVEYGWSHREDDASAEAFREAAEKMPVAAPFSREEKKEDQSWDKAAEGFSSFQGKYGSTSAGPAAQIYLGYAWLRTGKAQEALEAFSSAERRLKKPYIYFAQEGRAQALMQLKKWKDAQAVWAPLSVAEDNPLKESHLWNLALAQEAANESAAALATYKDFEAKYANSPRLDQVRTRIVTLQPHP